MKSILDILNESKNKLITVTSTGNVEITEVKMSNVVKRQINNELNRLYSESKQNFNDDKKFSKFLYNVLNIIEKTILQRYDVCPVDEEYSVGYSSYNLDDNMNKELIFKIGDLNTITDTKLGYKPITNIYDVTLHLFIYKVKKENTNKIESIYIS